MLTRGEQIRAVRIEKGYTQASLAKELYVCPTSVQHWENGRRLVPDELLDDVNTVLGTDFKPMSLKNKFRDCLTAAVKRILAEAPAKSTFEDGVRLTRQAAMDAIASMATDYTYQKVWKGYKKRRRRKNADGRRRVATVCVKKGG